MPTWLLSGRRTVAVNGGCGDGYRRLSVGQPMLILSAYPDSLNYQIHHIQALNKARVRGQHLRVLKQRVIG